MRARRSVLAVVAILVGVLTVPGLTTASASADSRQSATGISSWQASQRAALARAHFSLVDAEQDTGMFTAARLGSAKDALIDSRQIAPGGKRAVGFTARNGATGKKIWRTTFAEPFIETVELTPTVIGSKSDHGFLAVDFHVQPTSTPGASSEILRLRAVSGLTGKVIWTQTLSGILAGSEATSLPYFDGLLTETKSGVPNILAEERTYGSGDAATQAVVISGQTGAVTNFGGLQVSSSVNPTFMPLPDINGDAVSDVGLSFPGGYVQALDGSSTVANQLWTFDLPIDNSAIVTSIGTFGAVPSLVVSTAAGSNQQLIDVIRLKTGTLEWSRQAGQYFVLGTAGSPAVSALMLVTSTLSQSLVADTYSISYSAVSAANKVLYTHQSSVSVVPVSGDPAPDVQPEIYQVGDVQPDGSKDLRVAVSLMSSNSTQRHAKSIEGVISGKTGHFASIAFQEPAAGSLHHGAGTDLVSATVSHGHPQFTAIRGTTGKRLYRRTYTAMHGWTYAWADTDTAVSGHTCAATGLIAATTSHFVESMLDGRGDVLWTVKFANGQDTGGTLVTHSKPKHFCP
jgi:hypothetical protein